MLGLIKKMKAALLKDGQKVDIVMDGVKYENWYYMKARTLGPSQPPIFVENPNEGGPMFQVSDVDSWKAK